MKTRTRLGYVALAAWLGLAGCGDAEWSDEWSIDEEVQHLDVDRPDGFDQWSEECKKRWLALEEQLKAREKAEAALKGAKADQETLDADCAAAQKKLGELDAEQDEIEAWLKANTEAALKQELAAKANAELAAAKTDAAKREIIGRYRELFKTRKETLKKEQEAKKKRKAEIAKEKKALQDKLKDCAKKKKAAQKRVQDAEAALAGTTPADSIYEGLERLTIECGPKDPAPSSESMALEVPVSRAPAEAVCRAKHWFEGCVEFLWIKETSALYGGVSNPITKTLVDIMSDVNGIWSTCCVRYRSYLKIVPLKSLGALANKTDGIYVDGDRVHATELDKFHKTYAKVVKDLQDHDECIGLLMVDEINGDEAGFAQIGGKVGVIGVSEGDSRHRGKVVAHEIGHGVAALDHTGHDHGTLMWGKGSVDYPTQQRDLSYTTLLKADCEAMQKSTTETTDICE
jgi:hypothetical protein